MSLETKRYALERSRDSSMANTGGRPNYSSWLEVDLDAIVSNFRYIQEKVNPTKIIAVIKANAFSHGQKMVAQALAEAGAWMFGVSNFRESTYLRDFGIEQDILVMNGLLPEEMKIAVERNVCFFVYDKQSLEAANRAGEEVGKKARVHFKVDTGMGRLGVLPKDAESLARTAAGLKWLSLEGVGTHLASAHNIEHDWFTKRQHDLFQKAASVLDPEHTMIWHFSASSGVLRFDETYHDAVRFQSILYGVSQIKPIPWPLKPAAQFKARVVQVKQLPEGHNVGYSLYYTTPRETTLAIVPVGVVDGILKSHPDGGSVLIRGHKCRIVGTCACEMMVDATGTGVEVGDEVVMYGKQGDKFVSCDEFAEGGGGIYADIMMRIPPRVPRVYIKDGEAVAVELFCELSEV